MFRFCLSQPPDKTSGHFRGQLVNPNFAESIEFSTKFSETPLRKLILLTKRLSVEIDNLLLFICKEWRWIQLSTNILEERSFLPEISNQKLQIRVYTVPFQTLSLILQNVQKKQEIEAKLFSSDHWCLPGFHWEARKLQKQEKRTKSAKISFSVTNFRSSDHDDDKFALIPLMLAMLSFCVICHLRRQIRCPVRSQSHYCRRNEYKLNKKEIFGEINRFDNCYQWCDDTSEQWNLFLVFNRPTHSGWPQTHWPVQGFYLLLLFFFFPFVALRPRAKIYLLQNKGL